MRGPRAKLEDVFEGETEIVDVFDRDLKMAAKNAKRVARNAMTVEEQREYQRTKLPKIEAEVNAYVKEADSIYNQVMAALKKADGIASTVSALEKKAEKLVKPNRYGPILGVFNFDETKAKALYAKMEAAYRKIVECRDKASEIGYGLVNSFRAY
jgi:uncharacterized coiled-coil DUF342 family protein